MYQSKSVLSNQNGIHENLERIVQKHIQHRYRKPYQGHNVAAFEKIIDKINALEGDDYIVDSGCGTAMSTLLLAKENPESLVVGIDQSAHRLQKRDAALPDNCLLVQANCEDIWRMLIEHKVKCRSHYIYYPNPWPKSTQVKRRWHGHAVFPYLAKLSENIIVRSNWEMYLQEFAFAWQLVTNNTSQPKEIFVEEARTLFEKKYAGSGQKLYELELQS